MSFINEYQYKIEICFGFFGNYSEFIHEKMVLNVVTILCNKLKLFHNNIIQLFYIRCVQEKLRTKNCKNYP